MSEFTKLVYAKAFAHTNDHETALLLAAQAALETGHGQHVPDNNLFGIKAHGASGGKTLTTKEVVKGKVVTEQASFRGYKDYDASIAGRIEFTVKNKRYAKHGYLAATTAEQKAAALQKAGYATDPKYAHKLVSIIATLRTELSRA